MKREWVEVAPNGPLPEQVRAHARACEECRDTWRETARKIFLTLLRRPSWKSLKSLSRVLLNASRMDTHAYRLHRAADAILAFEADRTDILEEKT